MNPRRIALTGASGFIGSHLKRQLRGLGHSVVPLLRKKPEVESEWVPYTIEHGAEPGHLAGFDTLIHAAHDFHAADARAGRRSNVEATVQLFHSARDSGIEDLIFVSTLSAFPGCKSQYGKGKLEAERRISELGGKNARLGFVVDGTERGLSGALMRLTRTLPLIPLPGSGRQNLYTLAASDLGEAFLALMERAERGAVVSFAYPDPVSFADLLRIFARRSGRSIRLAPFPWQFMWLGLAACEMVGLRPPFQSDSLISLLNQNPAPDFDSMRHLGLTLRSPFQIERNQPSR
jgi:nucleoside-diphosphate-sugar epimerase